MARFHRIDKIITTALDQQLAQSLYSEPSRGRLRLRPKQIQAIAHVLAEAINAV